MATALSRCGEYCKTELLLVNSLRTAECEDDATGANLLECYGIEARIAFEGIAKCIFVLGKGWRIKHDEIVVTAGTLKILESVFAVAFVLSIRKIQGHISIGEFNGACAGINAVDMIGAAAESINAEAAGVAKHIEHILAMGVFFKQRAIVTLIYKEACLLTFEPIDVELDAILLRNVDVGMSDKPSFLLASDGSFVGEGSLALIVYVLHKTFSGFTERIGNLLSADVHADAMGLHDRSVAVDVDDESGQTVTFTMHEAEHRIVLAYKPQALANKESLTQTTTPKGAIYFFVFEREDADRDAADLVVADRDELVVRAFFVFDAVDDADEVAFLEVFFLADDFEDGSAEEPGVEASETVGFAASEDEGVHCSEVRGLSFEVERFAASAVSLGGGGGSSV